MTQRLSRHPWDPRGPDAPAEQGGEFKHLMTCMSERIPLPAEALFALCRAQTPKDRPRGARLVQWVAFIKGSLGAASGLVAYWILRPFIMLSFKGSLGAILLKSALALGLGYLFVRVAKGRFRALTRRYPWLNVNTKAKVDALLDAHAIQPSSALLDLIETLNAGHEGALESLEDTRFSELRSALNGLALTRWDIISELRAKESVLPNAILSAYDKASIPLMRMALDLEGRWKDDPDKQSAVIRETDERAREVRDKIKQLLETHKTRRADVSARRTREGAELRDTLLEVMSASHQAEFEAGLLELDTLIESDAELEA